MNPAWLSLIRALLKVGGGILITKGFADDSTIEIIIAGILALVGVVWGVLHRNQPVNPNPNPNPQ